MRAAEVLTFVVRQLVDNPDDVDVSVVNGEREVFLELAVNADDLGKVIGKRGRTAKALRTLVKSAGALDGDNVTVEILD